MIKQLLHNISAERTNINEYKSTYFFYQHQKVYSFAKKFVKNKRVLEIGSGSGYGTYRLSKISKEIIGIDIDSYSIYNSRKNYKRSNLKYINSSAEKFNTQKKFDVIVSFQVIEHIKKPEIIISKISKLLKTHGSFIVSTPNALITSFNECPYHYKEFMPNGLFKLLKQYFSFVTLYGLYGDRIIQNLENRRRQTVIKIFSYDFFRIRYLLPRVVRQYLFSLFALIMRKNFLNIEGQKELVTEKNFRITKNSVNKSNDLIAICKN